MNLLIKSGKDLVCSDTHSLLIVDALPSQLRKSRNTQEPWNEETACRQPRCNGEALDQGRGRGGQWAGGPHPDTARWQAWFKLRHDRLLYVNIEGILR